MTLTWHHHEGYQEAYERFGEEPVKALDGALRTWIHEGVWWFSEGNHPAIKTLRRSHDILAFLAPPPRPPSILWRGLMFDRPPAITEDLIYNHPGPSAWTKGKDLAEQYCHSGGIVLACEGADLARAGNLMIWPMPKWLVRHLGVEQDNWDEWVFDLKQPVPVFTWTQKMRATTRQLASGRKSDASDNDALTCTART